MLTTTLIQILREVEKRIPVEDVENILEFIENNEFGLAYETLCTQICEYERSIPQELYEKISAYGKFLGVESAIWLTSGSSHKSVVDSMGGQSCNL